MKFFTCAVFTLLLLSLAPVVAPAQSPARPFPQHTAYAAGAIIPSHVSRERLDEQTRAFYREWKRRYVVQKCGAGRYYVATGDDHGKKTATVSEAHGYGMIIMALMAGEDAEARTVFDGMYRYFLDHPAAEHPYLMSWKQDAKCRNVEGNNSATDGDMDIAYALLLADRQWGGAGAINYRGEAVRVISAIMKRDVHPADSHILLGSWVLEGDSKYRFGARTSDFMTHHLKVFRAASGDARWAAVTDKTYAVIDAIQTNHSPLTGLLPDFVTDTNTSPKPVSGKYLEKSQDGDYYFNACRVPWRVATDYLMTGDARSKAAANKINAWIRTSAGGSPARIRSGYKLDGGDAKDSDFTSMAFVAPFGVGAMVDAGHQQWLNGIWDATAGKPISEQPYYGNTLKMLCLIVMSGNWWAP